MSVGCIVWFDLFTNNVGAVADFYGPVIGWTAQTGSDYNHITAPDGKGVGGVMQLPAELAAQGVPPHWIGYTQVADVDQTVERATKLGAQVHVPPTDIPTTGRFAVLADPQGASFAVYAHGPGVERENDQNGLGHFAWSELVTSDLDAAVAFYSELFGWVKAGDMDMGPAGKYQMMGLSEKDILGGFMKRPEGMPVSAWVYYFRVVDCDAAYAKAKELGAAERYAPMDIPGGGRACLIADPQGATFGLVHDPKS